VGDFERAIAEYRYSIRAEPSATDARLRLGRLHVAEGAASLALAVLQHDSARNPVGLEAELLELRVLARLGRVNEVRTRLNGFSARPGALGRAVAAAAEGVRERQGVPAAAGWLQGLKGFDFGDPKHSEALGALVADLAAAGATDEALAAASGALAKHPDTATFHAIYAQALAADEAGAETVRAAYARALELDPGSAAALSGLGELAAAGGDADAALQLYAKAAAADPQDASALVASAELLVSLGRGDEAERALEQALERRPYDAGAAKRLAELLLERGGDLERALGLAKRAVRFGGGPAAEALVARIQQQQGGAELAKRNATGSAASPPPAEVGSEP
jgi:tetratricopeptide (TPR) repeat protein